MCVCGSVLCVFSRRVPLSLSLSLYSLLGHSWVFYLALKLTHSENRHKVLPDLFLSSLSIVTFFIPTATLFLPVFVTFFHLFLLHFSMRRTIISSKTITTTIIFTCFRTIFLWNTIFLHFFCCDFWFQSQNFHSKIFLFSSATKNIKKT